ncbi:MAG: PilX N-terminal domain-containing pilus assembly protein [Pseudoxanthomonas sp.]
MSPRAAPSFAGARTQRGAALYVALVILIVLALLGIVGMQVSVLQEKMSANYRNINIAFQNAETSARRSECYLEAITNRTTPASDCTAVTVDEICRTGFDATNWASQRALDTTQADAIYVRSIGKCISGRGSLAGGKPASEDANKVFQSTAYAVDDDSNPTANAAVDTIFIP